MKFISLNLLLLVFAVSVYSQPVQKASVSGKFSKVLVEKVDAVIPNDYNIYSACPNVFGPNTKIKIDVPARSDITINIYDRRGRFISNIVNDSFDAGVYSMEWLPAGKSYGLFSFVLISGSIKIERKIVLSE